MNRNQLYKKSIEKGFRTYWERQKMFSPEMLDPKRGQGRVPVFKTEFADCNLLTRDSTDDERKQLMKFIPGGKGHRWFRSMMSSQALALSVFGNLILRNQLDALRDLEDDEGDLVFGAADLSAHNYGMEHEPRIFKERNPTSLDIFISGRHWVAVECKLSEPEFGPCSRPRSKDLEKYCNRSYQVQGSRTNRCSLTETGVRYWNYVPILFKWSAQKDHVPCPLMYNYQLIRNVLAACVREDGSISQENGHAVLVYDSRNPAFHNSGKGAEAYYVTKEALIHKQNLRRVSWQKICRHLRKKGLQDWLTDGIKAKYGIEWADIV